MTPSSDCFNDVPRTPRGHLGILFYEAACCLVSYLQGKAKTSGKDLQQIFHDLPFLAAYWNEVCNRLPEHVATDTVEARLATELDEWESASGWLPLKALCQQTGLNRDGLLCLVLCGLVEEDARFADLFSALQQPSGHRRPTLGFLQAVLGSREINLSEAWDLCRPLLECGMLQAINRDAPRSEWMLRVPSLLWSALRGEKIDQPFPGSRYHEPGKFSPVEELILPARELNRLTELGPLLETGVTRTLVLRSLPGSDRREIIGSVARSRGCGLLEIDVSKPGNNDYWPIAGALCLLLHAIPLICLDLGPGETFEIPVLHGYSGPIAIAMGLEGGLIGTSTERSLTLHMQPETAQERLRHWQRSLDGHPAENLAQIVSRFTLPARYIRQAAHLAKSYAALERRSVITEIDVRHATRTISRQQLDSLATRLDEAGSWGHLVVTQSTEHDLHSLQDRCCHREQLATALGDDMPGGLNRGVRALFEGPSGTGKTLAARILATELGLELYRVDLAAIVNKYIGETEKNLSRVLGRAEDLDVVLLLDEGDALMARRTEVKSSHDRYANLETNYLLQRLETYTGIVIVTTNAGNYIDSAFRRRLDVVVKFHLPDAEERWRLWQLHLAHQNSVDSADLEQIALGFALTGGQIRNAAVHAKLLSVAGKRSGVSLEDLKGAINLEYRKAGGALPATVTNSIAGHEGRLSGFLTAIS